MTSPTVTVSPMTTDECSSSPMMMVQGRMNSTSSPCASSFRQEGSFLGSCGAFPSVSPFTPVSPSASGGAYNHLLGRHGRSSFVPPAPTTTPVLASPNTPRGPRFAKAIGEEGEEEDPVVPPQSPVSTIAEDDQEDEEIDQHQEQETESLHSSVSDDVSSQTEETLSMKSRSPRCQRTHKKSKKNKKKKSKQVHHPSVLSNAPAASTTFDGPNEELNNTFTGDDHQHEVEGKSSNPSPVEEEEEIEGTSRRRVEKNSIKIHTTTVLHHTNQQPEEQETTSQSPQDSSSPAAKKKAKAPSCSASHNNSFASIASSAAGPSMNSSSATSSTFSTTNTTSKVKVEVDARRGLEVGHPSHLHNVQARCGQHFEGRVSLGRIDRQFVTCPLERNYECSVFLSLENHADEKDEQATLTSKWRNDPYAFNVIPDPSLMMKVHAAQRDAILSSNSAMVAQVRQCFKPQISGINDRFQQQQQQKPHQWSAVVHHAEYNTYLNNGDDGMCTVADSYAEEGRQEEDNYYPQDNYDTYHYPCHDVHTTGRSPSCYHRPTLPLSGLPEDQRLTSNCESHQVQAYRPAAHLSITTTTSTTSGGQDMLQSFRQRRHSAHELSAISLSDDNIKAASSVSPSSPYRTPPQTVPRQPSTAVGQPGSQHLTQKRVMMSPISASSFSQLSESGRSTWENGAEGLSRSSSIVSSTSMISPNHRTGGGGSWHTAGSYPRTTTPFQAGAYPKTASIPTNGRRRLMYDSFTPY